MRQKLNLLGFAAGIAGNNPDCALAPWYLYYHPEWFQHLSMVVSWEGFIKASSRNVGATVMPEVVEIIKSLSQEVLALTRQQQHFAVIGGDHSCAIATWSAVAYANRSQGDIGLLWVDAHMDSHTPSTSISQNAHGMPLAVLLGRGTPTLCQLWDDQPKLQPQNVCLVGVRSYEAAERQLLEELGVRVYYMDEVHERGLSAVIHEAYDQISAHTCGVGFSIDMDAIDPEDAPGVGYREQGGLSGQALRQAFSSLSKNRTRLLGVEITEYNPILDIDNKTAHLLLELLNAIVTD
jgi:arginase